MQMLPTRTCWPRPFLVALELAGTASARLPFGMPDPIVSGASAVALYTGGLWPVTTLELTVANPGKLVAELFAIGCRWACDAGDGSLRHPNCEIGINIRPEVEPATPPELANQLRIALDREPSGGSDVATLKVVGIEDLVVDQIRYWLLDGGASGEQVNVLQALVASARGGVGGPLRTNYLQRRLVLETQGEVCIDDLPFEAGKWQGGTSRSISLTEMRARIHTWWALQGLALHTPRLIGPAGSVNTLAGASSRRRNGLDPVEGTSFVSATIVPFGITQVVPPGQR